MANLPTVADLGPTPAAPATRPVGGFNAEPIARGAEKIAAATSEFGKAIAGVGTSLADFDIQKNRYEYAAAHSAFLTKQIDLHASLANDQDYTTLSKRYDEGIDKVKDDASQKITDPAMQARFQQDIEPQIARGKTQIQQHAYRLEGENNVTWIQQQGDHFINQAVADPTNDGLFGHISKSYGDLVDGAQARGWLTPEAALKMKQDWTHRYAIAYGMDLAQRDPEAALNQLRAAPGSRDQVLNRIHQVERTGPAGTSSANGHFQFIEQTWLQQFKDHADEIGMSDLGNQIRKDGNKYVVDDGQARASILAMRASGSVARTLAGHLLDDNADVLKSRGVAQSAGNLYLAHFLGADAAARVAAANPNMPVSMLVSQDAIRANTGVLQGKTAGDVVKWAASKMGGVGPGGDDEFAFLRPDQRQMLIQHAEAQLHNRKAADITSFHTSVQDDVAQAINTGGVTQPKTEADFVSHYGADRGPIEFRNYNDQLKFGADRQRVATMTPAQQDELLESYRPKEGEQGYAEKTLMHAHMLEAIKAENTERNKDPATFAINRIPGMRDEWNTFTQTMQDPSASIEQRQQASRAFATRMIMEQQRLGLTEAQQRVAPQSYIDDLQKRLADPKTAGGSLNVYNLITREAQNWGPSWDKVYRQASKDSEPVFRVLGAGVKESAGQVLAEVFHTPLNTLLKDESDEKASQVKTDVVKSFAPLRRSMLGNEGEQKAFDDFRGQGEKLAAYYVGRGMHSTDAAEKAFHDLVGWQYDFRDGYRVPRKAQVSADAVQAGADEALRRISDLNVAPAQDTIGGLKPEVLQRATEGVYRRDGKWSTNSDESGLVLNYGDRPVRGKDGKPVQLTWKQLDDMGRQAMSNAAASTMAP